MLLLVGLEAVGCSNRENDCNYALDCGNNDAGNAGGTSAVGTSTSGTSAGGNATGGVSSACNPLCAGTKPACNESAKQCVECTADSNCSGTKPACNTTTNACVQCTKDANCSGLTPLCDTSKNTCVQCKSNTDCTSATTSLCSNGTCIPCAADADCSQITGKNACGSGTCVLCTVKNESACGNFSCNPATNACTSTTRGSVGKCQSCVADSECIDDAAASAHPSARCVPMTFGGSSQAHGSYCLQRFASVSSTGCKQPYILMPETLGSTSGVAAESYCGINETATTCEALLDLISGTKACALDTDCGQGKGGLCKTVGGTPNRCTIPCGSGAECLASPSPGYTCNTNVTPSYCQ